jgi:hypothetical protein
MLVYTIGDVVAGVALVLLVLGGGAAWAWVGHLDRQTKKRERARTEKP